MTYGKFKHIAVFVCIVQTSEKVLPGSDITSTPVCFLLIRTEIQIVRSVTQVISTPTIKVFAFIFTLLIGYECSYSVIIKCPLVIQFQMKCLGHIIIMVLAQTDVITIHIGSFLNVFSTVGIVIIGIPYIP